MAPMRAHKKSRSGCRTCRTRRVKCDGLHPTCKNCTKRGVECFYYEAHGSAPAPGRIEIQSLLSSTTPPPYTPSASASASVSASAPVSVSAEETHAFLRLLGLPRPSLPLAAPMPELDLIRLSLLHHYTTSTYTSFSSYGPTLAVWRDIVPRLAFSHPYVLHAILAISALHVSYLSPAESSRYQVIAADHYHEASVSLRTALPATGDSDGALFVASSFIAVYAFASPAVRCRSDRKLGRTGDGDKELGALTWVPILRGVRTVLHKCWGSVKNGELAPILQIRPQPMGGDASNCNFSSPHSFPGNPSLPVDLDALYHGEPDVEARKLYAETVKMLREAWSFTANNEFRIASTFQWPVAVSEGFVRLLMEKRPRALVLLGYYCAMLSVVEEVWWIGDRAKVELAVIEQTVGEEWGGWLTWVKGVVEKGGGTPQSTGRRGHGRCT